MCQTLFHIPNEVLGLPVFGFGLALAIWTFFSVVFLLFMFRRHGVNSETLGYLPLLIVFGFVLGWILPSISDEAGLPIRGYGVMLLLAISSAVALVLFLAWRRWKLPVDLLVSIMLWAIIPGILCARLFYVIEYWPEFQRESFRDTLLSAINLTQGGLVVYGSVLGGMAGAIFYMVWKKIPVLATFDLFAPGMMLGLAIGRIGCFLNGCCFGGPAEVPWAVTFPPRSLVHVHQLEHGLADVHGIRFDTEQTEPVIAEIAPDSGGAAAKLRPGMEIEQVGSRPVATRQEAAWALLNAPQMRETPLIPVYVAEDPEVPFMVRPTGSAPVPVHPTQLYSSLNAAMICLILLVGMKFLRRDGQIFALFLTIYPVTRFLLEMIRTDEDSFLGTGMTVSQNVSVLLLIIAAILWAYTLWKPTGRAYARWGEKEVGEKRDAE
jgi:phosphatidylglycerol:prolipoprotein diacylglycerol transferase